MQLDQMQLMQNSSKAAYAAGLNHPESPKSQYTWASKAYGMNWALTGWMLQPACNDEADAHGNSFLFRRASKESSPEYIVVVALSHQEVQALISRKWQRALVRQREVGQEALQCRVKEFHL